MRSLPCHLLVVLLVAFHGLGLCHSGFVAGTADCTVGETCGSENPTPDEVADETPSPACGDHGLPGVKSAASVGLSLDVTIVAVMPPAAHPTGSPPALTASNPARFASRSLPLLI